MKPRELHITDHAIVRYLERVGGVDINAVRNEICGKVAMALDHPGACGVIVDGFSYKLQGQNVTTVTPANRPDKRTNRKISK